MIHLWHWNHLPSSGMSTLLWYRLVKGRGRRPRRRLMKQKTKGRGSSSRIATWLLLGCPIWRKYARTSTTTSCTVSFGYFWPPTQRPSFRLRFFRTELSLRMSLPRGWRPTFSCRTLTSAFPTLTSSSFRRSLESSRLFYSGSVFFTPYCRKGSPTALWVSSGLILSLWVIWEFRSNSSSSSWQTTTRCLTRSSSTW